MNVEIQPIAPLMRCYVCGKTEIASVCHHCGRAMCSSHGGRHPNQKVLHVMEFSDIQLGDLGTHEPAAHCEYCEHYVKEPLAWLPSIQLSVLASLGGIGLVGYAIIEHLASLLVIAGVGLAAIGAIIFVLRRIVVPRILHQRMISQQPAFPIIGTFRIGLTEHIVGSIGLSDMGQYHVETSDPKGELKYSLSMTARNREQWGHFVEKYDLDSDESSDCTAGFIALQGRATLRFEPANEGIDTHKKQISLMRPSQTIKFLHDSNSQQRDWSGTLRYTSQQQEKLRSRQDALPFTIVPILVMEGQHRAVIFEINILDDYRSVFPQLGEFNRIEQLTLEVPVGLGQVRNSDPIAGRRSSSGDDENQTISWRDISITSTDRQKQKKSFYLSFENNIELDMVFKGSLVTHFSGTLSGIHSMHYFNAVGKSVPAIDKTTNSIIKVDFELSFESLRFQEDVAFQDTIIQKDLNPTYEVVIKLIDELSQQDFYFKQFIENPETTGASRAYTVNRYWDLEGRLYRGIYPIDFHVILKGIAVLRPQEDGYSGEVSAEISVKGTVTDVKMRDEVNSTFVQLSHNIASLLQRMSETQQQGGLDYFQTPAELYASMNPVAPIGGHLSPQLDGSSTTISQAVYNAIQDFFKGLMVVTVPAQASTNVAEPSLSNLTQHERLDRLMNALLNGYISENLYQRLRLELEQGE